MMMICGICGNIIYNSDDLDNQRNANMCSACGNIVCDDCYFKENMLCSNCNNFFNKKCDHLDCVANFEGFCEAENCAGSLSYNKNDEDFKKVLSPQELGEIYDAIANDLVKKFGVEGLKIENITFIDSRNMEDCTEECDEEDDFDYEDIDDEDLDDEEFDDMIDYFEKEEFDFGVEEDD